MNKSKQIEQKAIEEIAKVIEKTEQIARDMVGALPSPTMYDKDIYWHGYRKQIDGEWIWTENGAEDYEQYWVCSCCRNKSYWKSKFCEDCGAKMKGGAE